MCPDLERGTVPCHAGHSKSRRCSQCGDCEFHLLWQKDTLTTRSGASVFGTFCPLAIEDGVLYSLCGASWLVRAPRSVHGCRADHPLLQGSASASPTDRFCCPGSSFGVRVTQLLRPVPPSTWAWSPHHVSLSLRAYSGPETPPAHAPQQWAPGDPLVGKGSHPEGPLSRTVSGTSCLRLGPPETASERNTWKHAVYW